MGRLTYIGHAKVLTKAPDCGRLANSKYMNRHNQVTKIVISNLLYTIDLLSLKFPTTTYKWPLMTKSLFSRREDLSIIHQTCSMRVGDFKLIIRNYKAKFSHDVFFYRLSVMSKMIIIERTVYNSVTVTLVLALGRFQIRTLMHEKCNVMWYGKLLVPSMDLCNSRMTANTNQHNNISLPKTAF
uniref:SFRICE_012423 n=1 Tax=Spodoptera frugiperda TaxID=7108 RepID=A0A2H1W113_SPOFR